MIITDSLFESEVIGHEKGACTGNTGKKAGLIKLAEDGTVLLDEIGDLPASRQTKFLRVPKSGQFRSMRCSYTLTPDAVAPLKAYDYPGNVRELRNILFIAATHSQNRKISAELIESALNNLPQCNGKKADPAVESLNISGSQAPGIAEQDQAAMSLQEIETRHLKSLLEKYHGNRKEVAAALDISERTIYRKLKKLGLT